VKGERHRIGDAVAVFTGRADGDLGHGGAYVHAVHPEVEARRRAVVPLPWSWLRQVHGNRAVAVTEPGGSAGERADAAVTAQPGCAVAVLTADCAPVALVSIEGIVAAVHAGWRGLLAGVVEAAVDAMRSTGASDVQAVLGPCIHAECYEFGATDLARMRARFGEGVAATTSNGTRALDVPAAVRAALARANVDDVIDVDACTACSPDGYFSHRARGDRERQALVIWRER
jgi:YfiH family protein